MDYRVRYEIDIEADSPRAAAEQVWTTIMRRGLPCDEDDGCVFDVLPRLAGEEGFDTPVQIDLALPDDA